MPHQKINAPVVRRLLHRGDKFQMIKTQVEAVWVDFFFFLSLSLLKIKPVILISHLNRYQSKWNLL